MSRPDYRREPVFVLTSDLEWAPEAIIARLLEALKPAGIVAHLFMTHPSPAAELAAAEGRAILGIHPNFLPHSTHGDSIETVVDTMLTLVPGARSWRSHSFVDSTPISRRMVERGIRYDSNLCLYLQAELFPLDHQSGLLRFPVFWEDDIHWSRNANWCFSDFEAAFFQPGLKVINIHPLNFVLNIPSQSFYEQVKAMVAQDHERLLMLAHSGAGTATFVNALIAAVTRRGHGFTTLEALYRQHRGEYH
jgi:hypothetical protein